MEGIVVKVMNQSLKQGRYYKRKGTIIRVLDNLVEVALKKSKTVLKLDSLMVETVIPRIGGPVRVLAGPWRGKHATLTSVQQASFSVTVTISQSPYEGVVVKGLSYDHVCKCETK